jgi:isopentenyl-diphosphate delta-isomerase
MFNATGQLLIQRRAFGKRLWPGYWSNSCCSHPRHGENLQVAAQRRLHQEVGLQTQLRFLYKFEYKANFADVGSEHELCSVFVGHTHDEPVINDTEVQEVKWIDPANLNERLQDDHDQFTPWFRMEWQRIEREFKTALAP